MGPQFRAALIVTTNLLAHYNDEKALVEDLANLPGLRCEGVFTR